jgi:hypothetical protein
MAFNKIEGYHAKYGLPDGYPALLLQGQRLTKRKECILSAAHASGGEYALDSGGVVDGAVSAERGAEGV